MNTKAQIEIPYKMIWDVMFIIASTIGTLMVTWILISAQFHESNNIAGWALLIAICGGVAAVVRMFKIMTPADEYEKWLRMPDPYASVTMILFIPLMFFLLAGSIAKSESHEIKVRLDETGSVKLVEGYTLHSSLVLDIQMADTYARHSWKIPVALLAEDPVPYITVSVPYRLKHNPITYQMIWNDGHYGPSKEMRGIITEKLVEILFEYEDLHKVTMIGFERDLAVKLKKEKLPWVELGEVKINDVSWIVDKPL